MRPSLVLFGLALGALGCDDPPAATEVPTAPATPIVAPEDDEPADDEALPEEVVAPSFSEAELDAMDQAALESACFQGATAACDRLGH
jgi:hypothetical protein